MTLQIATQFALHDIPTNDNAPSHQAWLQRAEQPRSFLTKPRYTDRENDSNIPLLILLRGRGWVVVVVIGF